MLVLTFAAFIGIGLPDGLLGVATPSIRETFGLEPAALGMLLVAYTAGYLVSSALGGRALTRMGVAVLLALSCFATAASLAAYASVPCWALMVAAAPLAGLGAGAIDTGLNTVVATRHGPRLTSWLHASYGVGAAGGPAIMTAVLEHGSSWRVGYALVAGAQLALGLGFAASRRQWPEDRGTGCDRATSPDRTFRETARVPAVWLSAAIFFVYAGIEATGGVWAYSWLTEARGLDALAAGFWAGAYFVGLTLGRVALALLPERFHGDRQLRLTIAASLGAALAAFVADSAEAAGGALGVLGFALAPTFPAMIAATPRRVGQAHVPNAIGMQIAAAVVGQSLLPALVGALATVAGLDVVVPAIVAGAGLVLVLHLGLAVLRGSA